MSKFGLGSGYYDHTTIELQKAIDALGDEIKKTLKTKHKKRVVTRKSTKTRVSRPKPNTASVIHSRIEATDLGEYIGDYIKRLEAAAEAASSAPIEISVRPTSHTEEDVEEEFFDDLWDDLVNDANLWGEETAAELRASVPVDTGNLQESIHILKDECEFDKENGQITIVVGSDLNEAGGYGRLYAPPYRKPSRYGRKKDGMRLMPSPPNEYASLYMGLPGRGQTSVEEVFTSEQIDEIIERNAEKRFGK